MLKKLKSKWQKQEPKPIVEILPPELFHDEEGDGYYWSAVPNKDFLRDIAQDFPEAEQLFCEFYVPLTEPASEIRLLVTDTKKFPMNAPILSEDGKHYHFATPRGMELRWKLQINEGDNTSRYLMLDKVDKGEYKIKKVYINHHED